MAMYYTSIEYRIKPITRYIVTRHEVIRGEPAGVGQIGNEYNSYDTAYEVGYAVCRMEHERLGWPVNDARIIYPQIRDEEKKVEKASGYLGQSVPLLNNSIIGQGWPPKK